MFALFCLRHTFYLLVGLLYLLPCICIYTVWLCSIHAAPPAVCVSIVGMFTWRCLAPVQCLLLGHPSCGSITSLVGHGNKQKPVLPHAETFIGSKKKHYVISMSVIKNRALFLTTTYTGSGCADLFGVYTEWDSARTVLSINVPEFHVICYSSRCVSDASSICGSNPIRPKDKCNRFHCPVGKMRLESVSPDFGMTSKCRSSIGY